MLKTSRQLARCARVGLKDNMTKRRPLPDDAVGLPQFQHALPLPVAPAILVIGLGASAGGLDAFQKFFGAMPPDSGAAFILVQHLDPTHPSMMVELLSEHTAMNVCHAAEGMLVESDCVYIIPPGVYLALQSGALRLTKPRERHGARMPFDFLLQSLATETGNNSMCVILSGTGTDGSLGLKIVKQHGGLVIAQNPEEANYDGMPRNAIDAGMVDMVLPVAEIPAALIKHMQSLLQPGIQNHRELLKTTPAWMLKVIDVLRVGTAHDFTLYKPGTLQRRIEQRMAMVGIEISDVEQYIDTLRHDSQEADLLAKDLLINVTGFFRDPKVFDMLESKIIPDLVNNRLLDHHLRIWIAGCSTGEEAYSLAMLFREQIAASKRNIKLQVFASDVDPDAIASAREGLYPETIAVDISPGRLARFFAKEAHGYRVLPELRAAVIFTVQDVLIDPPFSRLDLVSCRNLLIYLQPEAQAKVISLFHFALREGGLLLLGNAETIGSNAGRFDIVSKINRIYRHVGPSRPGDFGVPINAGGMRLALRQSAGAPPSQQAALAELCRKLVLDAYAPASVLINRKHEVVYSLGPTDLYLHIVPGHPSHDLLAMARDGLRTKLRSAIQRAEQENAPISLTGGRVAHNGEAIAFRILVQPVMHEAEAFKLVSFIDELKPVERHKRAMLPQEASRVTELEQDLNATRTELQGAIRSLEISIEAEKEINEEALSVNEEYQAANEELLTSKEELQTLNEELTTLNTQLQETLERQRTTSNDLQNVLYSTDVATIFLDTNLNIRFFTPTTRTLFDLVQSDVGRPLATFNSLSDDGTSLADARAVLDSLVPLEREVETQSGTWFVRRTLPYRTQDSGVEGVVITFTDITERKRVGNALEAAKLQAQLANAAKSRFLAAASHDLRQPLQTLSLLQGLLAKIVVGDAAPKLVTRLGETLATMSGMLNALLDINQIEAGTIRVEIETFPLNSLFDRLREEFTYYAQVQGLELRVLPCKESIRSDPRLLEQMISNLLSNGLKYTTSGKVLLGCRHHHGALHIEVWDTGIGIAKEELQAIFEEYHQIDNPARERSRGLGLGLSIVQRLGNLLGHTISVHSKPGKGSVFAIEVALPANEPAPRAIDVKRTTPAPAIIPALRKGNILVIEDDPELRDLLEIILRDEGHDVTAAADGVIALKLVAERRLRPDLILADYNLPNGPNGLEVAIKLRERLLQQIPVIILTGDISTETQNEITQRDCLKLNKPVLMAELTQSIRRLLVALPSESKATMPAETMAGQAVVFVVDDDRQVRDSIRSVLEANGRLVETYASGAAFLAAYKPGREACLLVDAYMPSMSGLDLLHHLSNAGDRLPSIMITGYSDVPMAVQAMKAGALDFIEKPVGECELIASIERALEQAHDSTKLFAWQDEAAGRVSSLTPRQRQIMDLVLAGHPSKNIAADLGISQRTVENHRAAIMKNTGSQSLPALARIALAAADRGTSR